MNKPDNFTSIIRTNRTSPVSHRDYAVWLSLETDDWLVPMDLGATDGSWHSGSLHRLVKNGYAERKRRGTLMNAFGSRRGSYRYRRLTPESITS